jgi:hypothetical protein
MSEVLEISEKEWAAQVVELATATGWHRYHTYRSKKSPAGFPDETLVRERLVMLELKTESGNLSHAQREWIGWLLNARVEVYVARPRDLEALGAILGPRGLGQSASEFLRERTVHEISA